MLNPIELQLLPSCFGALSWSPDGDLAVAAGEHVQILVSAKHPTRVPPRPILMFKTDTQTWLLETKHTG